MLNEVMWSSLSVARLSFTEGIFTKLNELVWIALSGVGLSGYLSGLYHVVSGGSNEMDLTSESIRASIAEYLRLGHL